MDWFEFVLAWFPQLFIGVVCLLLVGIGLLDWLASPGELNRDLDKKWDHSDGRDV